MVSPDIFRAYDIRGLAPSQIDEVTARRLAKALVHLYHPKHVLIGKDMRLTSEALEAALVEGFTASGVEVTRIGLCSTPLFNFVSSEEQNKYDLGVMVTASHNPAVFNGFKLFQGGQAIGQGSGMEALRDLMVSDEPLFEGGGQGGIIEDKTALERYVAVLAALADLPPKLPAWRIAIDAGNGMSGLVLPKLCKRLPGISITQLYWDPDGSFPNHEANPLKHENLKALCEQVIKNECVFGAAYDGDGDRIGFVDETGAPIPGDILTALFAREELRTKRPGIVLYDVRSSWSVPETISAAGGTPEMIRVGHVYFKQRMREIGALFGGELAMHFYFSELHNHESGDYALLLMVKMLAREQKPLSQIWRALQPYAHSGEINYAVHDRASTLAFIEQHFISESALVSHLDGVRMEFRDPAHPELDWWFNIRLSNTESVIRLNLEAKTQEQMEARKAQLETLIKQAEAR